MTLYEGEGVVEQDEKHTIAQIFDLISLDAFLLVTFIFPMFFSAMHFYTAPFRKKYMSNV